MEGFNIKDGIVKFDGLIYVGKNPGLLSIINHLPSTLEAPHCGERSTAV
jgi:hypothetical protein